MTTAANNGRSRKAGLSKDAIVDCALELARTEGQGALTLRRIGQEFGADATAFYRHFRDKDALVLACVDKMYSIAFDEFSAHSASSRLEEHDWQDDLRAVASTFWNVAQRYPGLTTLGFSRITGGEGEQRYVEYILRTIGRLGLPPQQIVIFYRAFVDSLLALSALRASADNLPSPIRQRDQNRWRQIYGTLPRESFPATRAHVDELDAVRPVEVFTTVIDSLLDSIARVANT
ncbi:TetR family transcriptional regulator [Streptomyces canus]|uniref:TetR family transcriptional regulator n=1 Tax=Streptomyces canus TaxID=58343 RepID=UPI00382E7A6C